MIVEAKCGLLCSDQANQVKYLHEAYLQCEEYSRKDKLPEGVKEKLPDLMRMLTRYTNLVLTCAEMFMDP